MPTSYLQIEHDPDFDFHIELHKLKKYYSECLGLINIIENSDISDVREKVENNELIIPKRPRYGIKKLLNFNTTQTDCDAKLHGKLVSLLVSDLKFEEAKLPDKQNITEIFKFLTTCSESIKKHQAKNFYSNAVFGIFLDIYYKDFHLKNTEETWGNHVKKCFKISESHSRNLRSLGRLVDTYPKLQNLSISIREFTKLKKRIVKMLKNEEYGVFWKNKQ